MNLGFIGTGKITSSVVTGICRSRISFKKIILSPRNKNVANKLKKQFQGMNVTRADAIRQLINNGLNANPKESKNPDIEEEKRRFWD